MTRGMTRNATCLAFHTISCALLANMYHCLLLPATQCLVPLWPKLLSPATQYLATTAFAGYAMSRAFVAKTTFAGYAISRPLLPATDVLFFHGQICFACYAMSHDVSQCLAKSLQPASLLVPSKAMSCASGTSLLATKLIYSLM